jgi:hypothetical protein
MCRCAEAAGRRCPRFLQNHTARPCVCFVSSTDNSTRGQLRTCYLPIHSNEAFAPEPWHHLFRSRGRNKTPRARAGTHPSDSETNISIYSIIPRHLFRTIRQIIRIRGSSKSPSQTPAVGGGWAIRSGPEPGSWHPAIYGYLPYHCNCCLMSRPWQFRRSSPDWPDSTLRDQYLPH